MAVDDECTLRIIGRYQNQNIVNTMHYRIAAQTTGEHSVLASLCLAWETALEILWLACLIDSYTLVGLKAFGKTGVSKAPGIRTIDSAGAVVGDGAAASVGQNITLYTDDIKHRRRGRVMLSGTPQAHMDETDGSTTTAARILMSNLGVALILPVTNTGDEFEPGIPATAVDTWQDFTAFSARVTPCLIKSRRIREFLIG